MVLRTGSEENLGDRQRLDSGRMVGKPESAGINRHVGVSKEGWRIQ
jgi:hypothetical protein